MIVYTTSKVTPLRRFLHRWFGVYHCDGEHYCDLCGRVMR